MSVYMSASPGEAAEINITRRKMEREEVRLARVQSYQMDRTILSSMAFSRRYENTTGVKLVITERNGISLPVTPSPSTSGLEELCIVDTYRCRLETANELLSMYNDRILNPLRSNDLFIKQLEDSVRASTERHAEYVELTYIQKLSKQKLNRAGVFSLFKGEPLYVTELDILISVGKVPLIHPYQNEKAGYRSLKEKNRDENSFSFSVDIYDSGNNYSPRFMMLHGSVFEIIPRKHPTEEGVRVTYYQPEIDRYSGELVIGEDGKNVISMQSKLYSMEEAEVAFGLFRTREEALHSSSLVAMELATDLKRNEVAVLEVKYREEKLNADRDIAALKLKNEELQRQRDADRAAHEKQREADKNAHEYRLAAIELDTKRKESEHKDRTNTSTEKREMWKTYAAIAGVVVAVVAVWKTVSKAFFW